MKVIIYGNNDDSQKLSDLTKMCLDEMGLGDFIDFETIKEDKNLEKELDIKKEPALIVEEESIDFKDTIFEGQVPPKEELIEMFYSIIGGQQEANGVCGTEAASGCNLGCC